MNKALIIVDMFEHAETSPVLWPWEQASSFFPFLKYSCKVERNKGTKVILSYAQGRKPKRELNWDDYDIICELDELPQVVVDNKIDVTYFGGFHWGHCVLQHAFRLDTAINGLHDHWKYLSGHVNWDEIDNKKYQNHNVDCLNFVLNLTIPLPHESPNGWNQVFSMMKEYDKKYYLWSDKNGFEEL